MQHKDDSARLIAGAKLVDGGDGPLFDFDPGQPGYVEDPYPFWERVRAEQPAFFSENFAAWVISKRDDILEVLSRPEAFCSRYSFDPAMKLPDPVLRILDQGWENYVVVNVDPPEHTPVRRAINRALGRSAVEERVKLMWDVANGLIDQFESRGKADIATEYARHFPALVVASILGLPRDEVPGILKWGHDFETVLAGVAPEERLIESAHGLVEYQQYFVEKIEERRREPREDLLTAIVQEFDADRELAFTTERIANIPLAVFTAGHNTTTGAICNSLYMMLQRPEILDQMYAHPETLSIAVEEFLRYEPPFPFVRRRATVDATVSGAEIKAGDNLLLCLASANRDTLAFGENAGELDTHRRDAKRHLTFGHGIHFCPGAPLARREVPIALEALLRRLRGLRLISSRRLTRFVARGFESLVVEWERRA